MKERAQMRSVAALGGSALVFRVFALEAADVPGARPALWLSALLGALMALPAALPLARGGDSLRAGAWNSRAACGILCAASLWDAAVAARLFSALAAYAALPDHAVSALSLPAIAVATLVCLMGAGAMSAAGVVWRRAALALAAVALLAQAKALQPGWLFPLLGAGPAAVLSCAERAAGPMALAALDVAFLGDGDRAARARALRTLGRAALLCAGAALAFGMAVPVMPGEASNRLVRIAMLAGCGQSGFAAETIYVLLMAGGMLMVGFQILAASAALRVALPRASFRACALVCGAAAALLCAGSLSGEEAALAAGPYVYPAALLAAGLAALPARRREAAA